MLNTYLRIKTNECACCQCCVFKDYRFSSTQSLPSTILFHTLEQRNLHSCVFFTPTQLYFVLFRFLLSPFWKFMVCYTAELQELHYLSCVTVSQITVSLRLKIYFSCRLFVPSCFASVNSNSLCRGLPALSPCSIDRKFPDGKDSSLVSLIHRPSTGPGTCRCPINVNKMDTFIGEMFLADKNTLQLLVNSGLTTSV